MLVWQCACTQHANYFCNAVARLNRTFHTIQNGRLTRLFVCTVRFFFLLLSLFVFLNFLLIFIITINNNKCFPLWANQSITRLQLPAFCLLTYFPFLLLFFSRIIYCLLSLHSPLDVRMKERRRPEKQAHCILFIRLFIGEINTKWLHWNAVCSSAQQRSLGDTYSQITRRSRSWSAIIKTAVSTRCYFTQDLKIDPLPPYEPSSSTVYYAYSSTASIPAILARKQRCTLGLFSCTFK